MSREKATKLLGLKPTNGKGKLAANKGVLVIPDNYGLAILTTLRMTLNGFKLSLGTKFGSGSTKVWKADHR